MPKKQEYAVGEVVQLVSGGPEMAVRLQSSDGDVYCQWFAGKKLEKGTFPPESLRRVEQESK